MNKYAKILNGASGNYPRSIEGILGLDCAADAGRVSAQRMARCLNMWRDYESENGGAIETVPGWRRLFRAAFEPDGDGSGDGAFERVNGIFAFRGADGNEYFAIHARDRFYRVPVSELEKATIGSKIYIHPHWGISTGVVADASSSFFESGGSCYFLDGDRYRSVGYSGPLSEVSESAYVPVTYLNGAPYQQRNMLTPNFIERYTVDYGANKAFSVAYVWKYELVTENDEQFLRLVGLADGYDPSELIHAYIPEKDFYNGKKYPVKDFSPNFFDLLPHTVQLVVDAPLTFFGLDGSGDSRGRIDGCISGMRSLERLVLRHPQALYEFNACDALGENENGAVFAIPTTPLRELWLNGNRDTHFDTTVPHEYSNEKVGITSAYEGNVTLYVSNETFDMFPGSPATNTNTVNGVIFTEERTGTALLLDGVTSASLESDGGATIDLSVARKQATVTFDPFVAYSHVHLKAGGEVYCILLRDYDTGLTGEENGKWFEYTLFEPFKSISEMSVNGEAVSKFRWDADSGKAAALLLPSADGGTLDIRAEGYPNKFSTIENFTTIYDGGFPTELSAAEAINKCTVACSYDGRVFFTGNPALPNTVFFSGRGLNGENDPTYVGIYNYFNDGIGSVPNVAMVSSASMLAVFKGDISTDACVYYHVAQYNTDKDTADMLPRIYPSTEGVSNIPCVGAACNFADDIVFLSPGGLEGVAKQTLNLERTLSHRSGRVDPILKRGVSSRSRLVEWKGYLCVLNGDGTMLLADSRALHENEATGEAQYEWFMAEEVGSYSGDGVKWEYVDGSLEIETDVHVPLDSLCVAYNNTTYPVRIGVGEVDDTAEVISFSYAWDKDGKLHAATLNAVLVDGYFCPVAESSERIGGTFYPATALFEHRGKLYFGAENGDICVFNTDKRSVSYDEGEEPGVIPAKWYDRCGHRYESGFATLFDDCGYPQLAKSTVSKTMTLRAKRMPSSTFTLTARSEREDWGQNESFTVSEISFSDMDFANFSFADNERCVFSSAEKLKRWGEKQLYFYSDGFRQPFGIYGISYCYSFAGRIR